MARRYVLTILVIGLCSFPGFLRKAYAEEHVRPLSLRECIDRAISENLNLQSYYLGMDYSRYSVIQAQAHFDPGLSFSVRRSESKRSNYYNYFNVPSINSETTNVNLTLDQTISTGADWGLGLYNNLSESNIESKKNYTSYLGMNINQPLLRGFGRDVNRTNIYLARIAEKAALYDLKDTATYIISEVQDAYWNLVYALETLNVRELSLAQADSLLSFNQKGYELGVKTESDVLEARSELVSRQQEILDQRNSIHTAEDRLRRLLNMTAEEEWNVRLAPSDKPEISSINLDVDEAFATALADRPDYQLAKQAIERNKLTYAVAKNSLLPNLNLSAEYQLNGSGATFDKNVRDLGNADETGWNVGLILSYPLRNRSAKADFEKKNIDIRRAHLSLEDLKSQIVSEIRNSIRNVQINREKIDVAKLSVEVNEHKLRIEEERFRNNLTSSYYVLEFQRDLANARNQYNKALMDYQVSVAELRKARGTLLKDVNIVILANDN